MPQREALEQRNSSSECQWLEGQVGISMGLEHQRVTGELHCARTRRFSSSVGSRYFYSHSPNSQLFCSFL